MVEVRVCHVPGCNRVITHPDDTFVFCAAHWHDYMTPARRAAVREAYRRWAAGRINLRERRRVEVHAAYAVVKSYGKRR